MLKEFATTIYLMSKVRPWAAVAAIMAVLLMGYYLYLGAQYWRVTEQAPKLSVQVQNLARTIRSASPDEAVMAAELEVQLDELQDTMAEFSFTQPDGIVSILSKSADETSIVLLSITMESQDQRIIDDIQYDVQPMILTLQGNTTNIFAFVSLLHERIPVIGISGIRMTDLDAFPSAQIQLRALVNPELEPDDEDSN